MKGGRPTSTIAGKGRFGGDQNQQAGFTIIELLIATAVFSVILIVITAGVLSFTRQYYKGVVASNTQGAARAIIDDVTRAIQFNAGNVVELGDVDTVPPYGYCIGTSKRYSFAKGLQVTDATTFGPNQSAHALISDNDNADNCSTALNAATIQRDLSAPGLGLKNPREMLGEHMRLAKFNIEKSGDYYNIVVRVVYGDDDLLCSPDPPVDDCNDMTTSTQLANGDLSCKAKAGSQFCATSELSTTVQKRVE